MPILNSTTSRLLIVALCIAVPQVAVWQLDRGTSKAAAPAAKFDVNALPMQIGEWTGVAVEFDRRLFDDNGALSAVSRTYTNNAGRRASVHLTSHPTALLNAIEHEPAGCYPAHGWKVLKEDWQRAGDDRPFRLMIVEQSGARAAVVYWYQLGSHIVRNRDDLRPALQLLRRQGQRWPPVVKVMFQVAGDFPEDETKSPVEGLDSEIYKWVLNNS